MDATDNPTEETVEDGNSYEGIGASADEGVEYAETEEVETPDLDEDPIGFLESREDISDDLKETLKRGFLRQADYTRKTQAVAEERRRLDEQRAVVDKILLTQSPSSESPAQEDAGPPDVAEGASPQEVIDYYVNKAVAKKLDALGIAETAQEMRPVVSQQRVVRAYQQFASENPDLDHGILAAEVGRVLDSDADLSELAEDSPLKAVRLAAKVAKGNVAFAKTKAKSKKRREAAPVASRKGTVVRQKKRETALEAATRALKEQGF